MIKKDSENLLFVGLTTLLFVRQEPKAFHEGLKLFQFHSSPHPSSVRLFATPISNTTKEI